MSKGDIKSGDFSSLAKDCSKSCPDYSISVSDDLIELLDKPLDQIDFADVGAGTGIWTRMVYKRGVRSSVAIEPNNEMQRIGKAENQGASIRWINGSAEKISLPNSSLDWITMASSFHWTNFDKATKEFYRLLKPQGYLTALWNPRLIGENPILLEIESYLKTMAPSIKRVSSGLSGITQSLTEQLEASPYFENVVYLEGRHTIKMSTRRYITAWKSVNDVRVQLGPQNFKLFLDFIQERLSGTSKIEATYLTRAWTVSRKD